LLSVINEGLKEIYVSLSLMSTDYLQFITLHDHFLPSVRAKRIGEIVVAANISLLAVIASEFVITLPSSDFSFQLQRGSHHVLGHQGLCGQERVPGPALSERGHLHQSGAPAAVSMHLSGGLLGRELRAGPGGTAPEAEHGRPGTNNIIAIVFLSWLMQTKTATVKSCT